MNRVQKGGHDVSPERLKNRFFKSLENLNAALKIVDKCYLFDNSAEELTLIAVMENRELKIEIEPKALPNWFLKYVLKYY
jgi:predicted ABC-type ATPase